MKRVKAGCIQQTLVFSQKPDAGLSKARARELNRAEYENYRATLEQSRTRYMIVDECEQDDGSLVVRVKKQYNDKADVSEYFN